MGSGSEYPEYSFGEPALPSVESRQEPDGSAGSRPEHGWQDEQHELVPQARQRQPRTGQQASQGDQQAEDGQRDQRAEGRLLDSPGRLLTLFAVVLVCVIGSGFLIGLFAGDGGPTAGGQAPDQPAAATTPPTPDTLGAQARALDELLGRSSSSRDRVIAAVVDARQCRSTAKSARILRSAAEKRERLAARLGELRTGKLPEGDKVVTTLREAWKRSAAADRAFAAWAEKVGAPGGCQGGKPVKGKHYDSAVDHSTAAGQAKKQFVQQWNAIASEVGFTKRNEDQI